MLWPSHILATKTCFIYTCLMSALICVNIFFFKTKWTIWWNHKSHRQWSKKLIIHRLLLHLLFEDIFTRCEKQCQMLHLPLFLAVVFRVKYDPHCTNSFFSSIRCKICLFKIPYVAYESGFLTKDCTLCQVVWFFCVYAARIYSHPTPHYSYLSSHHHSFITLLSDYV